MAPKNHPSNGSPASHPSHGREEHALSPAPTGRKKIAHGKERGDAALGHESQDTSSPEGAKEVAQLPRSWTRARLGEIVCIKYGKTLPTAEFTERGYPVFGANGIIGAYSRYLYEDRQVLISCRGAYSGAINLSPPQCFITNNSLVLEIAATQAVSRDYLFYALQTVDKSKLVTGSAQP
jgi:hypothetical protein